MIHNKQFLSYSHPVLVNMSDNSELNEYSHQFQEKMILNKHELNNSDMHMELMKQIYLFECIELLYIL